ANNKAAADANNRFLIITVVSFWCISTAQNYRVYRGSGLKKKIFFQKALNQPTTRKLRPQNGNFLR
ncbi:MAG: hypothetical protein ACK5UP_03815, partial [Bacteroidota bacterium]